MPKYIRQRVPDCRASVIKSPTAVCAKSAARNTETIQVKAETHTGELVGNYWKPGLRTSCELVSN